MRWLPVALVVALIACGSKKKADDEPADDPAAGHALLSEYVGAFELLAKAASADVLDPLLSDQAAKGEALATAGKVSTAFAERHRRLIEVTRAIIAPGGGEAATQKVREFLDAVEGTKDRPLAGGLAEIAPALVEEVLRLHMLLDGTTDREKTRARYLPQLQP